MIVYRFLTSADAALLGAQPDGLFDYPVDPGQTRAFLESALHFMAVAQDGDLILSFASATILLHPDKLPSMFINEVGTRDEYRRQGHARRVTQMLIDHADETDLDGVWLGTEPDNTAALALYRRMKGDERTFVGFAWDGAFDLD
jgi:aminoglycoside 6'-N-acetyltransferase I